ncbi:cell wall metabolism sensor histidine kinase WalK [Lyngbya confervoides BDU141951]|uniref:histidine kinase n=2 Tax=Lyngbya TaxID=28073 RepID=A0ABD4T2V3_9CYAN|nr:HAMP domain-containing sensor histidine kinase [Lyngbya confervoides]MCM1982753.1 cell wall metabolism sensor histidine kinase WalK [Lyngbya confervoides BDU141951]
MAAATLVVSLLMTALTFWSVNSIQLDARLQDTRFGKDLGLLLAANVTSLVADHRYSDLAQVSRSFYNRTSSIRYVFYADEAGRIYYGIPFSESQIDSALTLRRKIQLPDNFAPTSGTVMVRQHPTPDGEVTDVFIPLLHQDQYLGVLALGINPNPTVVTSSHLTRNVTVAVFISIWVIFVLGAVFNAFIITKPIKELVVGVTNIAAGDFKQRVNLPLGGELGELIASFNVMAERLESYEEQNIEELTAEKAKLETLVSTIADGAILLDTDMNIVLANATARHLFGWEGKDVLGENILEHFPVTLSAELNRPLVETAQGEFEGEEFRVALQDPVPCTIRILLTTVLDQARMNPKGIAITVQDITREAELNEAKSQFISNVSHELRTPLFNIKSFIETLHEFGDSLSPEDRQDFLDTANRETDRLTRLVNDVLDLSRLESGKQYRFEAVDLAQPIEQTLRTYQLNARDKGIELSQEVEADLPPILGNYDLLLQVFMNLVGNALKFTLSGGKVVLRAYSLSAEGSLEPPQVRVEVADTGIGIAPEDQTAIFDRFFRVENRVHTLEGTGLGLSIVRNIVEKHHSQIHLVSEVGVGTTFWFDLEPCHPDQPQKMIAVEIHPTKV